MKKNKLKKIKTYPQKFNRIMSSFFLTSILIGALLGILWEKANDANITKAGLLSFVLIIFVMHYWILIDRFRLNKAKVDQVNGDKIKATTAWSHIYYKYIILISLLLLFILTMLDINNYDNKYDWITFTLSLFILLTTSYKFITFEVHFQKLYHFKLPKNLFVVE